MNLRFSFGNPRPEKKVEPVKSKYQGVIDVMTSCAADLAKGLDALPKFTVYHEPEHLEWREREEKFFRAGIEDQNNKIKTLRKIENDEPITREEHAALLRTPLKDDASIVSYSNFVPPARRLSHS